MTTTVSDAPRSAEPAFGERRRAMSDRLARVGRRFLREERPFAVVVAVFSALFISTLIRQPWGDDLTLHLSVLRRLLDDPWHPGDPVLDVPGGSVYYSPYTVGLALFGKSLGLNAYKLYRLGALVNLVLLISGVYRFIRALSRARWAPALALMGLGTWWGLATYSFSGFLPLDSLADCLAYPSTLGSALALHLWAGLIRAELRTRPLAGLGALLGVLLLVHEFSGMSATVGCAAILASRHRELRTGQSLRALLTGIGAAGAVILVWPYYHLWDVGQSQLDQLDAVHHLLYLHVLRWYCLAIPGVIPVAWRWWRDRTDVLALMFAGLGAVVAYGAITQHWSYGRSWPMVVLIWQAAIAVTVAELGPGRLRRIAICAVTALTAAGVWTQSQIFSFALPSPLEATAYTLSGSRFGIVQLPHAIWLDKYLKPDDVVLADDTVPQFEVAAHGAYNVATPWYLPEISVPERDIRAGDVKTMLAQGTSAAQRASLLAQYHVTWVLLLANEKLPSSFPAHAVASGNWLVLYQIDE